MSLEEIAELIAQSRCTVALTGAGISTASGIRDFRGPQGIWRIIDPEKFEISYFLDHPDEVWELFVRYFNLGSEVSPNPAHISLAELERIGKLCAVITQNIDGLHQKAGSKNVIELHGNLESAVCLSCRRTYSLRQVLSEYSGGAPRCKRCGGILKPDIIFFGEPLKSEVLEKAAEISRMSDVFLTIGTSLAVSPANQLPVLAKMRGAKLVIINEGATEEDDLGDYIIRERVEIALPSIVEKVKEKLGIRE
ncbi:MAG: NAD-dependent protein deacylase [Nitrososphaeria archaeon]